MRAIAGLAWEFAKLTAFAVALGIVINNPVLLFGAIILGAIYAISAGR